VTFIHRAVIEPSSPKACAAPFGVHLTLRRSVLAGPLHVAGVDAHHYGLLHPPGLRTIAQLINAALDRALTRPTP
jgi:hypothetical protein